MLKEVQVLIDLAKVQAVMTRRLDASLGGLGLQEFIILHHLHSAQENALRRIDLAEKIGFTASGITRLLAPMEKIGLVRREKDAHDARVSFVTLAPGGKRKYEEALDRIAVLAKEWMSAEHKKSIDVLDTFLQELHDSMR